MKYITMLLLFFTACGTNTSMVKDGDSYLYQGKEQIIVSFATTDPSEELLQITAKMIAHIQKNSPKSEETFLIEGLSNDYFYNFYVIAESLFYDQYKNKTLMYGYVSSLYYDFSQKELSENSFIALSEFQNFSKDKKLNSKENTLLLQSAVEFAIDDIFYVSTLELLERPERYFYPQKTKEELFRVLIYPEALTYWNYLQFRFGSKRILETATKPYNSDEWTSIFGEDIGTLESNFVSSIKGSSQKSSILSLENNYTEFTNSLQLYMSGTKKSLMSE